MGAVNCGQSGMQTSIDSNHAGRRQRSHWLAAQKLLWPDRVPGGDRNAVAHRHLATTGALLRAGFSCQNRGCSEFAAVGVTGAVGFGGVDDEALFAGAVDGQDGVVEAHVAEFSIGDGFRSTGRGAHVVSGPELDDVVAASAGARAVAARLVVITQVRRSA